MPRQVRLYLDAVVVRHGVALHEGLKDIKLRGPSRIDWTASKEGVGESPQAEQFDRRPRPSCSLLHREQCICSKLFEVYHHSLWLRRDRRNRGRP